MVKVFEKKDPIVQGLRSQVLRVPRWTLCLSQVSSFFLKFSCSLLVTVGALSKGFLSVLRWRVERADFILGSLFHRTISLWRLRSGSWSCRLADPFAGEVELPAFLGLAFGRELLVTDGAFLEDVVAGPGAFTRAPPVPFE